MIPLDTPKAAEIMDECHLPVPREFTDPRAHVLGLHPPRRAPHPHIHPRRDNPLQRIPLDTLTLFFFLAFSSPDIHRIGGGQAPVGIRFITFSVVPSISEVEPVHPEPVEGLKLFPSPLLIVGEGSGGGYTLTFLVIPERFNRESSLCLSPDIHRICVKKIDCKGVKIFQVWGGIEIF